MPPIMADNTQAATVADRLDRWPRVACAVLGAYAAVVGLVSFLGWAFDLRRLTDWNNDGISMLPNATLCAFFAGVAVLLLAAQRRRAARAFGLVVALIGWATAFQWLSGASIGIDQLLLFGREWGSVGAAYTGRMGPPGTVSCSLIGLALLLGGSGPKARCFIPALGVLAAAISGISLIGYLFDASLLFSLPRLTVIAMQTATCVFAVGVALILSEPECEPMATLLADSGAGALARRVLPFTLLLPLALGWLLVGGEAAGYYDSRFGTAVLTAVEVVLFSGLAWWAMKHVLHRERALRRSQDQVAAALADVAVERERLAVTLFSLGDAVIATDPQARITFMNPAAERLTGWPLPDAIGRPLAEVFNIVNEATRQPVESPVTKCLRTGTIVGLANHTVLIARDGKESPIDDSAAPIRSAGSVAGVVMVFRDITERRAAERGVAHLGAIVDSSDDAIIGMDLNGLITTWNRGAQRLLGYSADEAVGRPVTMVVPPDSAHEELPILERLSRRESVPHYDSVRRRKDGTLVDISLMVSPIRDPAGRVVGASEIARDNTERRAAEEALRASEAKERDSRLELDAANRAKDVFLATLSHELRTPLSAMVGWMSIIRKQGRTEEDLREGLNVIERNTRVQLQLIEDVLDMSRIVSGKVSIEAKPCDLAEVVRAAVDTVRHAANAKNIELVADLDPDARSGFCDPVRMQQAVWNLLANAVKFTPKNGKVTVMLSRPALPERSVTRISVADTGIGIAPSFLPFVFDRFRQADGSTRRKFGGLGLGLSIVKHLVETHGGTIKVESGGEGKGAMFTIDLPVLAVVPPSPPEHDGPEPATSPSVHHESADVEPAPSAPPLRLDGVRILVVDDEADARRVVGKLLEEAGAVVATAGSVPEALALLAGETPDVLVSDIAMPDEDGYDLLRQVRAAGHTARSLPAVALTAFAGEADARKALLGGFRVHSPRPVDPHDLIAVVGSLVGKTGPGAM